MIKNPVRKDGIFCRIRRIVSDQECNLILSGGKHMRKEEKKEAPIWEIRDPKPPVVKSGHMEERKYH